MASRGRITGPRVVIPERRYSPSRLFSRTSRILGSDELREWSLRNASLLDLYGLTLASVTRLGLRRASRPKGPLESEHLDRLVVTAALSAMAVTVAGRGSALEVAGEPAQEILRDLKERNDRAATCALAEGIHAFADGLRNAICEIAIGEGVRLKPGEKGGNPSLYAGQTFGKQEHVGLTPDDRRSRGVKTYWMAVDAVEGTTKSVTAAGSSGSFFYVTESPIRRLPDLYLNKCQLREVPSVDVDTDLPGILAAVAERWKTDEVNVFTQDKARNPVRAMAEMGACVRVDTEGDAFPAVACGLDWGVFEDNGRPLDGVAGNIGGAAELLASAAAGSYLGVRSTARFAALRSTRWEERYDHTPEEIRAIRAAGFDPGRVYRIEELIPGLGEKDGLFVASAITDNLHIPFFDGVLWGENFAKASVLIVGSSGAADLYRLTFAFRGDGGEAAALLVPIMESLLKLPPAGMRQSLREALRNPSDARRLRHEFATSYYSHFKEEGGRFRLDTKSFEAVESSAAAELLRALTETAPDWFA